MSTPKSSVLVSTKAQKFNILEVKEILPHLKHIFLKEKPIQPDLISSSLSGLKKVKSRRVLRKRNGVHGWNTLDLKGGNQIKCMHKIKHDFKLIGYIDTSFKELTD